MLEKPKELLLPLLPLPPPSPPPSSLLYTSFALYFPFPTPFPSLSSPSLFLSSLYQPPPILQNQLGQSRPCWFDAIIMKFTWDQGHALPLGVGRHLMGQRLLLVIP